MSPSARRYLELFTHYVGPRWPRAVLLGVLLLTSIALQLVNPQLLRAFIDNATRGAAVDSLAFIAIAFIAVALVNQVLSAWAQYVGEDLGWTATNALRADLVRHCLRLDLSFHKARTPGELIERIDGDVTALASFFSRFVVNVLANLALLLGVLVVVWRENLLAGVGFTIFALAGLLLLGRLRGLAARQWGVVRETQAQMYGFLGEHLAGTEDIRSNGAGWHVLNGLALHHREWLAARCRAMLRWAIVDSSTIVTFAVGHAMSFGVGGYLWLNGQITLGTVYLLFYYVEQLRRPIERLRRELEEVQRAFASIGRVDELLRISSNLPEGRGLPLPAGAMGVELDAVSFAYGPEVTASVARGTEDLVLRDVSLAVAPETCRSRWPPDGRSGCSAAPGVERRRSRGCSCASTTRPAGRSVSARSISGTPISTTSAAGRRWSPRTCSCSPRRCATTSRSSIRPSTTRTSRGSWTRSACAIGSSRRRTTAAGDSTRTSGPVGSPPARHSWSRWVACSYAIPVW